MANKQPHKGNFSTKNIEWLKKVRNNTGIVLGISLPTFLFIVTTVASPLSWGAAFIFGSSLLASFFSFIFFAVSSVIINTNV